MEKNKIKYRRNIIKKDPIKNLIFYDTILILKLLFFHHFENKNHYIIYFDVSLLIRKISKNLFGGRKMRKLILNLFGGRKMRKLILNLLRNIG